MNSMVEQCTLQVLRRSGRAIAANSLEDNTAAMLKSLSSMPHSTDSHKTRCVLLHARSCAN